MSSIRGLKETIAPHSLFGSFYMDQGSHYFHTPVAGGPVDKKQLTQVGQALKQLGIRHVPSYAPEGRDRMERVFQALQQWLPSMLSRAGLLTTEAANICLREIYAPEHNARFGKGRRNRGMRSSVGTGIELDEVLCVQEDHQVGQDNCMSWSGRSLQIPEQRHRRHYVKAVVCVHGYPDDRLALLDRAALPASIPEEFQSMNQDRPRKPAPPA